MSKRPSCTWSSATNALALKRCSLCTACNRALCCALCTCLDQLERKTKAPHRRGFPYLRYIRAKPDPSPFTPQQARCATTHSRLCGSGIHPPIHRIRHCGALLSSRFSNRTPLPAHTLYSGQRRGLHAAATAMRILHLALCKMRCASIQDAKRAGGEYSGSGRIQLTTGSPWQKR